MSEAFHIDCLKKEFQRRRLSNPQYSLRAFSKSIGVDIGVLSRTLSGKRSLSVTSADRISRNLKLTPEERSSFLHSIGQEKIKRDLSRVPVPGDIVDDGQFHAVGNDEFRVIADWYHYAIMEMTFIHPKGLSIAQVSRSLGISKFEARTAIERLLSVGLLKKEGRVLKKTRANITTGDKNTTSLALRRHQKQMLQLGSVSLDRDALPERNFNSMTMAIDPAKLVTARVRIEKFVEDLCRHLEGPKRKKVYTLQVGLFPLEKKEVRQ